MLQHSPSRQQYPSDLTDEPWAIMEPLIPPARQGPRGGAGVRSTGGQSSTRLALFALERLPMGHAAP